MTSHNPSLSGNTMGVTSGARSANPSGAPEFIPSFNVVRVARSLMFGEVFCRSLFVLVPLAIVLSFLLCTTFDYPIVLSVLLFTAFDPFGILKHFLRQTIMTDVNVLLWFFHFCKDLCDFIDQCNCILKRFISPFSSIDEYIQKGVSYSLMLYACWRYTS
jgi:hypothetical protein